MNPHKNLFRRFNDLPIFDAARWPARERLTQIFACLLITAFLIKRVLQLPNFPGLLAEFRGMKAWFAEMTFLPSFLAIRPFDLEGYYSYFGYPKNQIRFLWMLQLCVWLIETGILIGYMVAFLTREKARSTAKGFMETVFPLTLGIFPLAIILTAYTYRQWIPVQSPAHLPGLYALNLLLIVSGSFNLYGLYKLRKAFTIMSEARVLIRTGPYRWIRHPLYAAHFVTYFCCMLLHFQPLTVGLYVAFVVGQTWRARIEERKLASVFPEYEEYRRTTGMFFPKGFSSKEL